MIMGRYSFTCQKKKQRKPKTMTHTETENSEPLLPLHPRILFWLREIPGSAILCKLFLNISATLACPSKIH